VLVAKVEQYAERAVTTPYGILVFGPRKAVLVRPDGEQVLLVTVPDSRIALSADGRRVAIAGVDLPADITLRPRFVLYVADLADGSVSGVNCLAMPSVDALVDGIVYYRARTGDQDKRAAMSWTPGGDPVPAASPTRPGPRVAAALAEADPYIVTDTEGTPLTASGMRFGARLSPGGRWLYRFRRQPPAQSMVLSVAEVSGDVVGPERLWPLPPGCATAWGGNRRPTWEDDEHLLLVLPHDTVPGTRAIRVDVTTGATERVNVDRVDGPPCDVEVFVEPLVARWNH
jgi:hypothetical protein